MNLSLVDPFILAQDYPEVHAGHLRQWDPSCAFASRGGGLTDSAFATVLGSGHATCLRFNHRGDFLASGRVDGTVVIFDIETNGVARKLRGHTRQMQSLSWSRDGRYLLSSSQDWKCILWDLKDGSKLRVVRFEAPVYIAELHPYDHLLFVASLFEDQPRLVDMTSPTPVKRILPSAPKRQRIDGEDKKTDRQAAQDAKQTTCVTVFTASGDHILAGTSKGWLNIIETATCQAVHSTRLCNGVIIFLRLTQSGREMVVNSSDRIIRTIHLPDLARPDLNLDSINIDVEHKFQDVVNRLSWNHVAFSSNGEYVMASTYKNHDIYVWERSQGSLVKILEGPKEELGVVEWHPQRPFVAACGLETGKIYLWTVDTPQRWSALAPDFAEVEENVEYIEKEDEFDIHPSSVLHQRRLDLEDEDVDVLTMEPIKMDEGGNGDDSQALNQARQHRQFRGADSAFRMPVLLDISDSESEEEIVAVGPGTMRRKSPGEGRNRLAERNADAGGGVPSTDNGSRPTSKARHTAVRSGTAGASANVDHAALGLGGGTGEGPPPGSTSNKRARRR